MSTTYLQETVNSRMGDEPQHLVTGNYKTPCGCRDLNEVLFMIPKYS